MLAEKVTLAVIVLTILSTTRQEDLPLHSNIIKHDTIVQEYGNKTRTRKFIHENNSTLQEETLKNISNRINNGISKHIKSKIEPKETLKAESAGGGDGDIKSKSSSSTEDDDEDKKTLAQQVVEGKYGLIHTELFQTPPKRPGVLSYKINPEVPKDNVNNLGGLEAEEIWLAENHLLVLAGGGYSNKGQLSNNWPPIDDYSAPRRQVKIPSNPKVPPPFPIQLTENGPIELVRGPNGSYPQPLPFFPPSAADINVTGMFPFFPPYPPPPPPGYNSGNFTPGNAPPFPGFPFLQLPNGSIPELPPFPPGFRGLPPGIPFPPPANWTDLIDEDDPSIYYPPPYDFYFPKDNSSYVPAGPLVPGIVLPPPPDFFAPLDNVTVKPQKSKTVKGPIVKKVKYQPPKQYFETQTKVEDVDNSITTPPVINYHKTSTDRYRPTKPSLQTINDYPTTEVITNEVTPSSRENKDDWVPIPAPHPYFITGPGKPLKENVLVVMNTPKQEAETEGYQYTIPKHPFRSPEEANKYSKPNSIPDFYNQNHIQNDNHVYADEPMIKQYKPVTMKPKQKLKTTVVPAQVFHVPVRTGGKALQTSYYFYEDPASIEDMGLTPPPKKLKTAQNPAPPPVQSNTPPTQLPIIDYYIPKEPVHIKPKPINTYNTMPGMQAQGMNPYNFREQETTLKPSLLDYFYFNGEKNGGYNFVVPQSSQPAAPKATSRPIFEYSYTAPGYKDKANKNTKAMDFYYNSYPAAMTTNTPPSDYLYNYENSIPTTPAPPVPLSLLKDLFVGGPPKMPSKHIITTTTEIPSPVVTIKPRPTQIYRVPDRQNYQRTSTPKPWRGETSTRKPWREESTSRKPFHSFSYTTQDPFYAFFTHQDESLVDDITKKYFTIFGQKIKKPLVDSTTPLNEISSSKEQKTYKYKDYDQSKESNFDSKDPYDNLSKEMDAFTSKENQKYNNQKVQNSNEQNHNYNNIKQNIHDIYQNSKETSNSNQNSQENYYFSGNQHANYDYNSGQNNNNIYRSVESTEDPNSYYTNNKNNNRYSTSSRATTTIRPKYTYQQQTSKTPTHQHHIVSLSNSFNLGNKDHNSYSIGNKDHKRPILEYDYDYDYDNKNPAPSLKHDTRVNNYKKQSLQNHKGYQSEWLPWSPSSSQQDGSNQYSGSSGGDSNQFISYKLPGNGNGHFFFLTPQAVQFEELEKYFFPSKEEVETRQNNFKRNTDRTRRRPLEETSTNSLTKEKNIDRKKD